MAGRLRAATQHPAMDRLPDRLLADIGLDAASSRRRGWTEYLRELVRHIGPTRA